MINSYNMPEPFRAGVTICGCYSEGMVYPQYQYEGEWWFWMPGTGTIPESKLVHL